MLIKYPKALPIKVLGLSLGFLTSFVGETYASSPPPPPPPGMGVAPPPPPAAGKPAMVRAPAKKWGEVAKEEKKEPPKANPVSFERLKNIHVEIKHENWEMYELKRELDTFMQTHNIKPAEVLVAYDLDGTLVRADRQPTHINPTTGKEYGSGLEMVRGGEGTVKLLEGFNKEGIKWFILSGANSSPSNAVKQYTKFIKNFPENTVPREWAKITEPKVLAGGVQTGVKDSFEYKKGSDQKWETASCYNVVSAYQQGNLAFDKDIGIEYIIHRYFGGTEPKLIVFVDDNAMNVYTVVSHFKHKQPDNSNTIVIGIVIPPQGQTAEAEHGEGLRMLHEFNQK